MNGDVSNVTGTLCDDAVSSDPEIPAEAMQAIADCAKVIGVVFSTDPRDPGAASVIEGLSQMDLTADWPFGDREQLKSAQDKIREGAKDAGSLHDEYARQFIGPDHFEAPQWASVYLDPDEVVFGNSHLEVRDFMRKNGIGHAKGDGMPDRGREPDDSFGKETLLLSWLADDRPALVAEFLSQHLMTWAPRYLELFNDAVEQPFWVGMCALTRTTLDDMLEMLGASVPFRKLYH